MRTQSHLSLIDVPDDLPDCDGGCFRPGSGLCCPDDPLDLVLQLFPAAAAAPTPHELSLTALGIGGSSRRQDQPPPFRWAQENGFGDVTVLGAGSAPGGGGVVWERDSFGLSSCFPENMETIDVGKYLVDHAPDADGGGGEVTVCNPSRDTRAMPAGGVRACGALSGVVSNYAPPLLAPMSAGAPQQFARRAFDGVVPNGAPSLPASMPAGGGLHACGALCGGVSNVAPSMPVDALPACRALVPVVSDDVRPLRAHAPPMPVGALNACRALVPVVSDDVPPLRAHAPASARSLPASRTSSASLTPTTSETSSPAPVWQPLAWPEKKKRRHAPFKCCKRPWSLDFPLRAVPVTTPDNPGDSNGKAGSKNSCNNAGGGGGIRRRRPVPRQRNRQVHRVCSHCGSLDTPQWRAGPDGPGTLCNACGIRYASGKLLPEYRPSTAPSFQSDQHSNRHRKVVKLREQKAKETLKATPDPVPVSPKSDGFMDVCRIVDTYQQACDIPSI
jgi:hypothetical protein